MERGMETLWQNDQHFCYELDVFLSLGCLLGFRDVDFLVDSTVRFQFEQWIKKTLKFFIQSHTALSSETPPFSIFYFRMKPSIKW